jgi:hypothetical protein
MARLTLGDAMTAGEPLADDAVVRDRRHTLIAEGRVMVLAPRLLFAGAGSGYALGGCRASPGRRRSGRARCDLGAWWVCAPLTPRPSGGSAAT